MLSPIAKTGIATAFVLALWAVQPVVAPIDGTGQGLSDCDIDIRPAPPQGRGESQVYWGEAGGGLYGAKSAIYVMADGLMEFGNGDATQAISLKAGKVNEITWWWDNSRKVLIFKLDNKVDAPVSFETTDYTGRFDSLGVLKEPTSEFVRRGVNDKKRLRITMANFGITCAFTLTDS